MTARRSILVVDDEYSLLESLSDILELEGYSVTSASNGQRALTAIERALPDAILLDFMMPVMDGLVLLKTLEERKLLVRVPVVLMTAAPHGLPRDKKEQRWSALLTKPFEISDLLETLERVIEKQQR